MQNCKVTNCKAEVEQKSRRVYDVPMTVHKSREPICEEQCCQCRPNISTDMCCASAGVVASVAMKGAAVSHILNAEGEKIQRILGTAVDACDILRVNCAVNETIERLIKLEEMLYLELDTACGCGCGCNAGCPDI